MENFRTIYTTISRISSDIHKLIDSKLFTENELYSIIFARADYVSSVYKILPNFKYADKYTSPMEDINNFLEALDKEVELYGRIVEALFN